MSNPLKSGRVPVVYQRETSECLLACIAMVVKFWSPGWNLSDLRRRFPSSTRGLRASDGISILERLGFDAYASSVTIEDLRSVAEPVILHWRFRHYVVLVARRRRYFIIHDPGVGVRRVCMNEFSESFTGVAIFASGLEGVSEPPDGKNFSILELAPRGRHYYQLMAEIIGLTLAAQIATLLIPITLMKAFNLARIELVSVHAVALVVVAYLSITLYGAICTALRHWAVTRAEHLLAPKFASGLFDRMFSLPVSSIRRRRSADLASRYESIEAFRVLFSQGIIESIVDSVALIVVFAAVLVLWAELGLFTIVAAGIYGLSRFLSLRTTKALAENMLNSKAQYEGSVLETIKGYHVVQASSAIQRRREHWLRYYSSYLTFSKQLAGIQTLLSFVRGLVPAVEMAVVLGLGILAVATGSATVGALVGYMAYRQRLFELATTAVDRFASWKEMRIHIDRLEDVWLTDERSAEVGESDGALIEMRGVSFAHAGENSLLLEEVSMRVDPGQIVAISGRTGCGKSTLLSILLGHEKPSSGRVFFSNKLRGSPDKFCVVFQDDVIFSGTIIDNVTLGERDPDPGLVESALDNACLLDDVKQMSMGLESNIGENGTFLSGGQRQRLLIARALYREPYMLVMDEGTSHLDLATERKVMLNLKSCVGAVLLVTHRPETLELCDFAYVLDNKKLINANALKNLVVEVVG